jgi:(S)-2-hydroxyglutarate dehydrogenase
MVYDYVVIGGGIVGICAARSLLADNPNSTLLLIEKETVLAAHQTGRNSGVVHAGVYYQPGSLKATLCKQGAADTLALCEKHEIPVERCGKLIVATNALELDRLDALRRRTEQNQLAYERLDGVELRVREPRIRGLGALYLPATAIVDYRKVTQALADELVALGGEIRLGEQVTGVREDAAQVTIETTRGVVKARRLVACAGLYADRIAKWCGVDGDFAIVPFRGEYFRLGSDKDHIVRHLIYPVPDPDLPFLGVHLTRMIGGYVTVGPNAVLSFKREGYGRAQISLKDSAEMLGYPGFWRLAKDNARSGLDETLNSLIKRRYLALCQKYCPELRLSDLRPHPPGVRAQAVMRDGSLVHDFLIRRTRRTVHVCNAPSPAATSAMPIGRKIAAEAAQLE